MLHTPAGLDSAASGRSSVINIGDSLVLVTDDEYLTLMAAREIEKRVTAAARPYFWLGAEADNG
jgi:hypothetical protein